MIKRNSAKQKQQPLGTGSEWDWFKRYRVWDTTRKIFVYPENWIEPDLRLPTASRAALRKILMFICKRPRPKGVRLLLIGRNQRGAFVAAYALARDLEKNLYRIDLSNFVCKYIGETEKNLDRLFDAAKKSGAILFFDEADALLASAAR